MTGTTRPHAFIDKGGRNSGSQDKDRVPRRRVNASKRDKSTPKLLVEKGTRRERRKREGAGNGKDRRRGQTGGGESGFLRVTLDSWRNVSKEEGPSRQKGRRHSSQECKKGPCGKIAEGLKSQHGITG